MSTLSTQVSPTPPPAPIESTPEQIQSVYKRSYHHLGLLRKRLQRPLTLAEKILFAHLKDPQNQKLERGKSFLLLEPDRVAMQDATAQMALLQFMLAGKESSQVPATVHCDHLIQGQWGKEKDLPLALKEHQEVFEFLASASSHYNIGFWPPGAGIIHQVVLENYAFPGGLMIGTDSHTPNAGGLNMLAIGVGGADASDVMAGLPWELKNPQIIGVHLTGQMQGWTSAKDVILKLCGILTVKGGTDCIIEYFGPGTQSISCTGKATITNMGAELGATCSVFPFDERMSTYLKATRREEQARLSEQHRDHLLVADPEVSEQPEKFYDKVISIDLSTLEPHIVGPHSPDLVHPISTLVERARKEKWPLKLSAALIGSCTNSSYEDIGRASQVALQAQSRGLKMPQHFLVTPGSTQIQKTIERDGQMKLLESIGGTVLANACGPCIGQWKREDFKKGEVNTILSSFNRNFSGRNDANPETLSFIGSPEMVVALGLAGRLDFNPLTDKLTNAKGESFLLKAPEAPELPSQGFAPDPQGVVLPKGKSISVQIPPQSRRLQKLQPFPQRRPEQMENMILLAKVKGKCTTDHICPGGPWLRFRGHLDNISDNLLMGAENAFTGERGQGLRWKSKEKKDFAPLAREYKAQQQPWIIVGDENYGEGSSREHAAMSPRFLGCSAVLAKSFARIHETNLKKQGILTLTFVHPEDYNHIQEEDQISLPELFSCFAPQKELTLHLQHKGGETETIPLQHSYNEEQIKWFYAGSALNFIQQKRKT